MSVGFSSDMGVGARRRKQLQNEWIQDVDGDGGICACLTGRAWESAQRVDVMRCDPHDLKRPIYIRRACVLEGNEKKIPLSIKREA